MLRVCYVCQKPVLYNDLGFKPYTHKLCRPGTKRWLEYFDALPEAQKTDVGKLIANAARSKQATRKEKFDELKRLSESEPSD